MDEFRVLMGLLRAYLLGNYYDIASDSFLTYDEIPKKDVYVRLAPADADKKAPPGTRKQERKGWYQMVADKPSIATLISLQAMLKSDDDPTKKADAPRFDPILFPTAILCTLKLANDREHSYVKGFYDEWLATFTEDVPGDIRLVFNYDDQILEPKGTNETVDFITSEEAKALNEWEAAAAKLAELSAAGEKVEPSSFKGIKLYPDLVNFAVEDAKLKTTGIFINVISRDISKYKEYSSASVKTEPHKSYRDDALRLSVSGSKQSKSAPTSSTKTPATSAKPPPVSSTRTVKIENPVDAQREQNKKNWASQIVADVIKKFQSKLSKPKSKGDAYHHLAIAANYKGVKHRTQLKKGGDSFNLITGRLLISENQTNGGIIWTAVPAMPLFPDGHMIKLAINAKDAIIERHWFPAGDPEHKLTANNASLAAWIKQVVIPDIWAQLQTMFDDYHIVDAAPTDVSVDERIKRANQTAAASTGAEARTAFGRIANPIAELGFMARVAAVLPQYPEAEMEDIGGDPTPQFEGPIAKKIWTMTSDNEAARLKVIAKNMSDLFKTDTKTTVAQIRSELIVKKVQIDPSRSPFVAFQTEVGTNEQRNVSFRTKVNKAASPTGEA